MSGKIYILEETGKNHEILKFCQTSGKKLIKVISQHDISSKSKNDVCSQEMYGYGSLLVFITPFIEYVLKVTNNFFFSLFKNCLQN